jgi:hypothetical protein
VTSFCTDNGRLARFKPHYLYKNSNPAPLLPALRVD